MSAWIVYSKDGKTQRCELKRLEYSGSHMGERAVTATFEHHSEVAFDVFDYIVYRGEKFELESIPSVKKVSRNEYEYELRFVSLKYELERCEMRDIVPNDNGVVYPTPLTFSFTGDVRYLSERIQANLDALYGKGVWNIVVAEGVSSDEKNISIAQQNCWNALSLVNTTYGLNFSVRGREVVIGGEIDAVSHTFQYGKGNGLYEIERASDTEIGIVTKLRAYGSTKNLDYSYPKKPEWADSALPVSFALSPLRLMLPSFKEDGKTDYVLADDAVISKYGIREASIVYEDIYPSIAGATNENGEAIDEIASVEEIDESKSTFVVYLRDLGFDLEEHLTTSEAQLSMKTGTLQGYTFNISVIDRLSNGGYKLTLGRNSVEGSEESGFNVPNKDWNMKAGDKFVLLNILMPQAYIREAEQRLLIRAKEYLAEYGKTNFSYNVGLHDKFLVEHPSVYDSLVEGVKLRVQDNELGISEDVIIQSITITEASDDNILPQVKVTLNNKPSASTLDRIQGKLNDVIAETSANNFSSQNELMAQYRKKLDKPFFDKLFSAVDANGNEIASNDVSTPVAYIKAKYDVLVLGGVTMYGNDESLDLPTLAEGLPYDQRTIWFNPETKQIEVIGGTGGGVADSVLWDNVEGKPSWITSTKPNYSYSEILGTPDLSAFITGAVLGNTLADYTTLSYLTGELKKYVTIKDDQDIVGVKNFLNGIKISHMPIRKLQDDVIYIDANVVVRGGVTMYYQDGEVDLPSIIDEIGIAGYDGKKLGLVSFSSSQFSIDANGNVTIKGGSTGLDTAQLAEYLTTNKYATQGWVENKKYLTSHQQIYNLTISKNGTIIGIYTPNSSPKSLDIIVPTKLSELDNDSSFATTNDLDDRINDLINGAPAAYDTLKEIADVLSDNIDSIGDILTTLGTKANNSIKISAGTGLTGGGDLTSDRTLSLDKSGVSAGTYKSVTVDIYGRVTSGYNPTTLSGYGITDAYTKTQLDNTFKLYIPIAGYTEITGEKNFTGGLRVNNSPVIYYDEDNKYWKLEGDLLVTGGVSMYSDDTDFIPSTIMDAVVVDGTSIRKNPTTGALEVIGGSGATVKYPLSWSGFNQGSYDGSVAQSFYIPTKLSEFVNDKSFATTSDLSGYLSTSGGTINGSLVISNASLDTLLTINRNNGRGTSVIRYTNITEGFLGSIGVAGGWSSYAFHPIFIDKDGKEYKIYHAGNLTPTEILTLLKTVDGSGSELDADTLDGQQGSYYTPLFNINPTLLTNSHNLNDYKKGYYGYRDANNPSNSFGHNTAVLALQSVRGVDTWQIAFNGNGIGNESGPIIGIRGNNNNQGWTKWFTLATVSSNVASATKLKTARTIWGQSFDGSANITGNLTVGDGNLILNKNKSIHALDANGNGTELIRMNSNPDLVIGTGIANTGYGGTYIRGYNIRLQYGSSYTNGLMLNSAGNVLIGTITDSGYKLDVNGKVNITSQGDGAELLRFNTERPWVFRQKDTGSSSALELHSSGAQKIFYITSDNNDIISELYCSNNNASYLKYKGDVFPSGGSLFNLGRELTRWKASYVDNSIVTYDVTLGRTLNVNGINIYKSQDDVLYIDGNLVVRGGVTMYSEGEVDIPTLMDSIAVDSSMYNSGGVIGVNRATTSSVGVASFNPSNFTVDANGMVTLTSAPSSGASYLGELLNVDDSIDATASVDRVLYQPAGSSTWTWRELPKDGVVGDYLPLSGGTLTGGVVIAPSASYTTAITDSCTVLKLGSDTSSMNGYNSGLGFNALQRYSSNYLQHLHAWIGLSPCIDSAGSELYDLVFATNGSTTGETSPIERMRITHDGSVKIQKLFFGNTNEINSLDGVGLCLNYEGAGYTFIGNNGYSTIVGSWSSTTSSQQNVLKGATLSVFGTIFGYRYGKKASGAAFMFDKPGANYTGIGADGTTDTIYFGACNQDGDWVFHNQIWKFGGSIVCGALKIWDTNVIDGVGGSTVHLNYYETSDVTFCKGGGTTIAFGNLLTHGGITMYSDQRKKTILNHVELSLKQIADAPLIQHYYNSDQNKTTHVGSIAQYWASLNDWFCKLDNEGFYTMEIQNCALASAISIARHLEKYESKTDKKIRQLKKRISQLEDELELLKKGV